LAKVHVEIETSDPVGTGHDMFEAVGPVSEGMTKKLSADISVRYDGGLVREGYDLDHVMKLTIDFGPLVASEVAANLFTDWLTAKLAGRTVRLRIEREEVPVEREKISAKVREEIKGQTPVDRERVKLWLENYRLLVEIINNETRLFWERYNIHLVLDSGLLAAFGFLAKEAPSQIMGVALVVVPILGLIVSFVWLCTIPEGRGYYIHRMIQAREIEEHKLAEITIFKDVETYNQDMNEQWEKIPLFRRRRLQITWIIMACPITFIAVWAVLFFYGTGLANHILSFTRDCSMLIFN